MRNRPQIHGNEYGMLKNGKVIVTLQLALVSARFELTLKMRLNRI